jgi:HSP20 family protein
MLTFRTPFPTLDRVYAVNRELDRVLNGANSANGAAGGAAAASGSTQSWTLPLDVVERADDYLVVADLPGVSPDQVDISFERNTLTVRGTRPWGFTTDQGELRVYSAERWTGSFERSVRLPEYVEGDRIEASFANGVLTITVPKAAAAKPRKITIQNGGESKQLNA